MSDLIARLRTMSATGWHPIGNEAADEIDRLTRELDEARAEHDEVQTLCDKLAGILGRTVDALRGAPPPLTLWGWHDLPERAEAMRTERDALRSAIRWALGHNEGDPQFGEQPEQKGAFAWRTELRRRAGAALAQIEQEQPK